MASLYICKLKINAKLQEKTLSMWDMLIHHVLFRSVVMVDLKQQKSSPHVSWNYQN